MKKCLTHEKNNEWLDKNGLVEDDEDNENEGDLKKRRVFKKLNS